MMETSAAIDGLMANADIASFSTRMLDDSDNEASVAAFTSLPGYIEHVEFAGTTPAMLPTIIEIAFETNWDVSVLIIRLIPFFARALGIDEFTKSCSRLLILGCPIRYSMYAKQ
jgi:hypothetical protein